MVNCIQCHFSFRCEDLGYCKIQRPECGRIIIIPGPGPEPDEYYCTLKAGHSQQCGRKDVS